MFESHHAQTIGNLKMEGFSLFGSIHVKNIQEEEAWAGDIPPPLIFENREN